MSKPTLLDTIDFLEEQGCLEEFKAELTPMFESIENHFNYAVQNNYLRLWEFISSSFTWQLTKQGHRYWSAIHDKWQEFLSFR